MLGGARQRRMMSNRKLEVLGERSGNATLQELVDKSFQINKSSWTSY
jgi:hypothetical protein